MRTVAFDVMAGVIQPMTGYRERVIDDELDELLADLGAVSLEGPKGIGKTATAERRGKTIVRLDDPTVVEVIQAQPDRLVAGTPPIVIDEWQRFPSSWDLVRRAVDADSSAGRFILTGSATPIQTPTHSGAGRIVPIRMRPLSLPERGVETPTVSLAEMLDGGAPIEGTTAVGLEDYVAEIVAGGFPGMRHRSPRARRAAVDGYLERIIDTDLPELGVGIRSPRALRRWLAAYAAATATTTSYDKIRDAATPAEDDKPAKTTTIGYRNALERIWVLDPVPAWSPSPNHLSRLKASPKHNLADPALAARLVDADERTLLAGHGPDLLPYDGTFLGQLFESLAALSIRVFAQASEASVTHYRDRNGRHEIDFIVGRNHREILGIEVKLSATVNDRDVRHLLWLREQPGAVVVDMVIVTTGSHAYRRADGVAVVPLALLGP